MHRDDQQGVLLFNFSFFMGLVTYCAAQPVTSSSCRLQHLPGQGFRVKRRALSSLDWRGPSGGRMDLSY